MELLQIDKVVQNGNIGLIYTFVSRHQFCNLTNTPDRVEQLFIASPINPLYW